MESEWREREKKKKRVNEYEKTQPSNRM